VAFFMPVFFGMAGLGTDLTILRNPPLLLMALGLIAIASIGKFSGAFIGAAIGGLTRREALALAFGMNARGSTEVIVATIGVSMGVLSRDLFTMIVAMAISTTLAMPPMLRWGLSRVPLGKAEQERLEREEFEAKGFIPNLKRLLIAVDDSPNGRFASQISSLIATRSGMPTTILRLGSKKQKSKNPAKAEVEVSDPVVGTAKAAAEDVDESTSAEIMLRKRFETANEDAVTTEAKKGYDLLFVGIDNMKSKDDTFSSEIDHMAAAFEGSLAIVMGQGDHLKQPGQSFFNILVPIAGTAVSRCAAEVAICLGRARGSSITALYVADAGIDRARRPLRHGIRGRAHQEAILKEIVEIAERYDQEIRTAIRSSISAEEAILNEEREGHHNLIVMGVNRRSGEKLYFGDAVANILDRSSCSILLLSS
jgi:K+:H+ antiporter